MARIDNKQVKLTEGMKIKRPITDPAWNAKQCGTRVRMSKKTRLREREKFRESAGIVTKRGGA